VLLLIGTAAFLAKTTKEYSKNFHIRSFWILMSVGMAFWLAYQAMWNYFEVVKRQDVPTVFLGDIVLFLHLVPMIAAIGVLPHLHGDAREERLRMLDFSLLLTWWVFIYVYVVVPWQTVQINEVAYGNNLNLAYLTEKLVLLFGLMALVFSCRGGWGQVYGHLLGASTVYAASSFVANWAIGRKTYYSGSIYDIPLTISIAWMCAVPILSERFDLRESDSAKPLLGVWMTRLSMLALLSLPWLALHAELNPALPAAVSKFRIIAGLITMCVMGVLVFWRQRLLASELAYFLDKSRRSIEELKALQEQLIQSEKVASLGQLVGGAAHEINNPLTAMLGYSDLLSASNLPPEEHRQALTIGEQVRRTKTLVTSLLTFVRPSPAQFRLVDFNSVLRTSVRLLPSQTETKGVAVRLDLAPSLPQVRADSNQLLQICLHLAGQIAAQLDSGTECALCIRTRCEGDLLLADFFAEAPFLGAPSFNVELSSKGANRPSTLSLSACCRMVEEHGARIMRPSNLTIPAFRLELPVASKFKDALPARAAVAATV
jgi:hypothetical protein